MTKKISLKNLPKPWTRKQFLFAQAYVGDADCNATKAAKMAGYSEKTSFVTACNLLRKPNYKHVQDFIASELECIVEQYDVSKETLIQRLAEIALTRISDVIEVNENGRVRMKPFEETDLQALGAVKSVSDKSGNTDEVKVDLHDPLSAIKEIAKLTNMYDDASENNNVTVNITIPDNGRLDPNYKRPE